MASDVSFPAALSGGALSGRIGAPVLLMAPAALSPATDAYLGAVSATASTGYVYGRPPSPVVQRPAGALLGGP